MTQDLGETYALLKRHLRAGRDTVRDFKWYYICDRTSDLNPFNYIILNILSWLIQLQQENRSQADNRTQIYKCV